MRLYPRNETVAVDHADFGHFEAKDDGGFDFPGPLADQMHSIHIDGRPAWENAIERQRRLIGEEAARRADPATLLDAVEELVRRAGQPVAPATAPAKTRRTRKAAAAAADDDANDGGGDDGDDE